MKYVIVFALLIMPSICHAWDTTDTALQIVASGAIAADWMQTRDIARHSEYVEKNPILGKRPHKDKIDTYFAACLVGHAAISYLLPDDYRNIWQVVWIGIEVTQVTANAKMGIRMEF